MKTITKTIKTATTKVVAKIANIQTDTIETKQFTFNEKLSERKAFKKIEEELHAETQKLLTMEKYDVITIEDVYEMDIDTFIKHATKKLV